MNDNADDAKKEADPASSKRLTAKNRFVKFAETTRPEAQIATKFIPGYLEGYYLITNIFKRENYFERGMAKLRSQGLEPQYFRNPKDNYIYVYLKRYDNLDEAKQSLFSNVNNSYDEDLYI